MLSKKDLSVIQANFMEYLAESSSFPSKLLTILRNAIKDKTVEFIYKVLDSNAAIVYYGPDRKIYVTPNITKFVPRDITINEFLVVGILSRSIYKYTDIYGYGSIKKDFIETFECFYTKLFKRLLKYERLEPPYLLDPLSDILTDSFLKRSIPLQEYFLKSNRFPIYYIEAMISGMIDDAIEYLRESVFVSEEILEHVAENLEKKILGERFFYYDSSQSVAEKIISKSRAFEECTALKSSKYRNVVFLPSRVFKIPIEVLTKYMETAIVEVSTRPLPEYTQFITFFTKVI